MSDEWRAYFIGKDSAEKTDSQENRAEQKRDRSIVITNDNRNIYPHSADETRKKPSWVEKGTLIILTFTFFAAAYAGIEAYRLAEWTKKAVSDSEIATSKQEAVTTQSLQFAKEAADAASASALASEKAANTAAKNVDVLINSERARLLTGSVILANEDDPMPKINYVWINFGRGPAIINDFAVDCQIVTVIPVFPLESSIKIRRGQFTLGSGVNTSAMPGPLPPCTLDNPLAPDDWAALKTHPPTKFILFQGFVDYEDAFRRYRWHFGSLYYGDLKFFSTNGLPPGYNQETQQDQPK